MTVEKLKNNYFKLAVLLFFLLIISLLETNVLSVKADENNTELKKCTTGMTGPCICSLARDEKIIDVGDLIMVQIKGTQHISMPFEIR